jgi:hypothetical protein
LAARAQGINKFCFKEIHRQGVGHEVGEAERSRQLAVGAYPNVYQAVHASGSDWHVSRERLGEPLYSGVHGHQVPRQCRRRNAGRERQTVSAVE